MHDHSNARPADDSTPTSKASGAATGSARAPLEPGVGKKCFASSACWALDSYTSNGFSQRWEGRQETDLECDDADENTQDEEKKGDDEPDNAPHLRQNTLASQKKNRVERGITL